MTGHERSHEEKRALRDAARGAFDARLARLKGDIEAHGGIAGKARSEAARKARGALDEGLAIARESKGIIAGTIAALSLWFLREPIADAIKSWMRRGDRPADVQEE